MSDFGPKHEKRVHRRKLRQRLREGGPPKRGNVVMVRVNEADLGRIDELVESGQFGSRSEATAFLVGEGIKSKQEMFDKMAEKISRIQELRTELEAMIAEDTQSEESDGTAHPGSEA